MSDYGDEGAMEQMLHQMEDAEAEIIECRPRGVGLEVTRDMMRKPNLRTGMLNAEPYGAPWFYFDGKKITPTEFIERWNADPSRERITLADVTPTPPAKRQPPRP